MVVSSWLSLAFVVRRTDTPHCSQMCAPYRPHSPVKEAPSELSSTCSHWCCIYSVLDMLFCGVCGWGRRYNPLPSDRSVDLLSSRADSMTSLRHQTLQVGLSTWLDDTDSEFSPRCERQEEHKLVKRPQYLLMRWHTVTAAAALQL